MNLIGYRVLRRVDRGGAPGLDQMASSAAKVDEVEIMTSGVLAFHRFRSRRESERTLLVALSPSSLRRCQLERDG